MKLLHSICTLAFMASARGFCPIGGSRPAIVGLLATATPIDFAKSEIAEKKVVVFSKSRCPFCMATKQLFDEMELDYTVHELDQMEDGPDVQQALLELSGQRTVPNVFINGKHLGGNDDTQLAATSGKLEEMLSE